MLKFLLLLLLLLSFNLVYSYTNISSCSDDPGSSGEWRLNQSISIAGGSCLLLGSSNILIDCQGFLINSTNSSNTTYGIDTNNYNNITIQNCNVKNFGIIHPEAGIYVDGDDSTILNINTSNNYYGVILWTSNFGYYSDITSINDIEAGIRIQSSSNNILSNIMVTGSNYGIYLVYSGENNFSTLNLDSNTVRGIHLRNSDNNSFIGGDIRGNTGSNIQFESFAGSYPKGNFFTQLYIGNGSKIGANYNFSNSTYSNVLNGNYWDNYVSGIYCVQSNPPGTWSFCDSSASSGPVVSQTPSGGKVVSFFSIFSFLILFLLILGSMCLK